MLTYKTLTSIVHDVHSRFTYVSDIMKYGKREHWVSFNEIPDGRFSGDCEDFAQAVRKELAELGEKSRLATCGVNSDTMNHAVCVYDDYVIDNIHHWPMRKSELATYKFISISGFEPGDPWREICSDK